MSLKGTDLVATFQLFDGFRNPAVVFWKHGPLVSVKVGQLDDCFVQVFQNVQVVAHGLGRVECVVDFMKQQTQRCVIVRQRFDSGFLSRQSHGGLGPGFLYHVTFVKNKGMTKNGCNILVQVYSSD